jgi:hypothetical protein
LVVERAESAIQSADREHPADSVQSLVGPPAGTNLLVVCLETSVQQWLEQWRHTGSAINELTVLTDEPTRAATAQAGGNGSTVEVPFMIERISDPTDLGALCEQILSTLERWNDESKPVTLVVNSLTPLLTRVGVEPLFRALHLLTARLDAAGVDAYFYLDASDIDDQCFYTLETLFDETCAVDARSDP